MIVGDGQILDILPTDGTLPEAATVVDATGLHVLPGLVDPDVNFRDPGLEYKETWATGARSAVCGGFTTVMVMPNTGSPVRDPESWHAQRETGDRAAWCNYALKAVVVPENLGRLKELADLGAIGFRFSMAGKAGVVDPLDDGQILDAFTEIAALGMRCGVHAENAGIVRRRTAALREAGDTSPLALTAARPPMAELEATQRAILFARAAGVDLALYHVSAGEVVDLLTRVRQDADIDVVAETSPHYALMEASRMAEEFGPMMAMNPPIRPAPHPGRVLAALHEGVIDVLGSDHSPHTFAEKNYHHRDAPILSTTPGWPGVETSVPVMLSAVNEGRLGLREYVARQAEQPARAWGLYPAKGRLGRGADADLTIVDLDRPGRVDQTRLHTLNKLTTWHGWPLTAAVACTIVGGRVVARDGELTAREPSGRFVRPLP
ncbi:dihydroorotase [Amycolatopsis endophytica]